jgi:HAMP domain-containing protein
LRTRVVAASALAFLGLAAMVCLVLPRAYEHQMQESFSERTASLATALAFVLYRPGQEANLEPVAAMSSWLAADPSFQGAAVLDADGRALSKWPESSPGFDGPVPHTAVVHFTPTSCIAFHPNSGNGPTLRVVAVRRSTESIVRDFENVRWLFATIFLFTSGVFFILTTYLTRTILHPLEEIRRAAMSLADGEPVVEVPHTGDREIDELGEFISKLGESRRQSRVMMSPNELRNAQSWGRNPMAKPSTHERSATSPIEPVRPPSEEAPD